MILSDERMNGIEKKIKYCKFTEISDIRTSDLQTLGANITPVCVFKQVSFNVFFKETNRYEVQTRMDQNTKIAEEWFPITNGKLRAYFPL